MAVNPFTRGIALELCFSLYFAITLVILYGGTLYILLITSLPIAGQTELKYALSMLIIMQGIRACDTYLLLQHHPLQGAYFIDANTLVLRNGHLTDISPYFHVSRYLIVLTAEFANQQHNLIIFPDSLPYTTFRLLQIRLRHAYQEKDNTN